MNYRKFKLDKDFSKELSGKDLKVLEILESVVISTGKIYQVQQEEGFYPEGVSKKQIEDANKKNPSILSPFTHVSLESGKLVAEPYHKRYEELLKPIAKQLEQAANICDNRSFKVYLRLRAKSLLDGSYKEADIAWLKVKNYKIDFSIAPFERYLDCLFFIKRIYQAHIGVISDVDTELANKFQNVLYSSANTSYTSHHSMQIPRKGVEVLVEDTPAVSGYATEILFLGEHFPCDLDIMDRYGAKILIYNSQIKLRFKQLHYPVFQLLFEKRFARNFSKDLLYKVATYNPILYELTRQLHKYVGSRERMKELYGIIDEANSFASGIQHCKYLLAKGVLSQEEFEAIIINHIIWMFGDWLFYRKNKCLDTLVKADAIALNFYLSSGALKEKEGIYWPNFSKIFFEIESLAEELSYLLEQGTHEEAKKLIDKNANLHNFEALSKKLDKLPVKF